MWYFIVQSSNPHQLSNHIIQNWMMGFRWWLGQNRNVIALSCVKISIASCHYLFVCSHFWKKKKKKNFLFSLQNQNHWYHYTCISFDACTHMPLKLDQVYLALHCSRRGQSKLNTNFGWVSCGLTHFPHAIKLSNMCF